MLQERIEEVNSAIVDLCDNKIIFESFYSNNRLNDFLNSQKNCRLSLGVYPIQNINTLKIKDNALFIIRNNSKENYKVQYTPIYEGVLNYKDEDKQKNRLFKIRRDKYSGNYNYIDSLVSLEFKTFDDLQTYLKTFNYNL